MGWAIILIIWTVVAFLVPRNEPDPEPDWSADDPRMAALSENIRRARARHSARAHWTREARAMRKQFGRVA